MNRAGICFGSRQIGPRTTGPWGPIVRPKKVVYWAPDSLALGPKCLVPKLFRAQLFGAQLYGALNLV